MKLLFKRKMKQKNKQQTPKQAPRKITKKMKKKRVMIFSIKTRMQMPRPRDKGEKRKTSGKLQSAKTRLKEVTSIDVQSYVFWVTSIQVKLSFWINSERPMCRLVRQVVSHSKSVQHTSQKNT